MKTTQLPAHAQVMDMIAGKCISRALSLVADLGLADLRVSVFDQPHVIEETRALLDPAITTVPGDFFEPLPGPVDACLLKHIIHDWDDAAAVRILKRCAEALNPGGRILLAEMLVHDGPGSHVVKTFDLEMLAGPCGRERTREEFAELFSQAGLQLSDVVQTPGPVAVIEAVLDPGQSG